MSKEVKRYNFDVDKFGSPRAYESEHGRWMKRADYDALLAERDALAKDAERYRWLRNPDQDVALVLDKMVSSGVYEYRAGDELDAAIDAAMQGDQQ
jgi:hypothetical protein